MSEIFDGQPGDRGIKENSDLDLLNQKIAEALSREVDTEESRFERLGIEARSILKSIETETVKLKQFEMISRTDRHYFRARFNYYKLSILRLRSDERDYLEPKLVVFYQEICQREIEGGNDPTDLPRPTAILEPVPSLVSRPQNVGMETSQPPYAAGMPSQGRSSTTGSLLSSTHHQALSPQGMGSGSSAVLSDNLRTVVQELELVKMALQADPSKLGQQTIATALDRAIEKIQAEL